MLPIHASAALFLGDVTLGMRSIAVWLALWAAVAPIAGATFSDDCNKLWTVWWEVRPQPVVRLPRRRRSRAAPPSQRTPKGPIVMCPTNATVTFYWRGSHGVWLLPGPECPPEFNASTGSELFPVTADGTNARAPPIWTLPAEAGIYYATSQAPGDCEAGKIVAARVISGAEGGWGLWRTQWAAGGAGMAAAWLLGAL